MYLMYVDETGDSGMTNSKSRYFVLTGLIVHEQKWRPYLEQIISFRRRMRAKFGLYLTEEIHASHLITRPGPLVRIKRNDRLTILREFADELAAMPELNIINVVIDKQNKTADYDVFKTAWTVLIQRFENTLSNGNFKGQISKDEKGILVPDNTDNRKLTMLLRKLRRYNPVPHMATVMSSGYRNLPLDRIIEDPNFRDSADSYFIQAADVATFLAYQHFAPNSYMRKKSGQNYFTRLQPILCTAASSNDKLYGIVRL